MHPIFADRQRLQLHLTASGLVGALLGLVVRSALGADWFAALAFGLPLGLVAAPVSLSAWYLCRAMPLSRTSTVRVVVTALGAAVVTSAIWAAVGLAWWPVVSDSAFESAGVSRPALVGSAHRRRNARVPAVADGALCVAGVRGLGRGGAPGARVGDRATRGRTARLAGAGRSAFSLQQPQLDLGSDRCRSRRGASDVPVARRLPARQSDARRVGPDRARARGRAGRAVSERRAGAVWPAAACGRARGAGERRRAGAAADPAAARRERRAPRHRDVPGRRHGRDRDSPGGRSRGDRGDQSA